MRCSVLGPEPGTRWTASVVSGSGPGVNRNDAQASLPGSAPRRNAGSSPARTSDDFPLPDGETRARKRVVFSRSNSRWTSASRPKNSSASSSSNACRPRYGQRGSASPAGQVGCGSVPRMAPLSCASALGWSTPARRSTHGCVHATSGSVVASKGSDSPGSRTGKRRKSRSRCARRSASPSAPDSQSPSPCGPTSTAQVAEARIAAVIAVCWSSSSPADRYQPSSHGSRPAAFSALASRSAHAASWGPWHKKTSNERRGAADLRGMLRAAASKGALALAVSTSASARRRAV